MGHELLAAAGAADNTFPTGNPSELLAERWIGVAAGVLDSRVVAMHFGSHEPRLGNPFHIQAARRPHAESDPQSVGGAQQTGMLDPAAYLKVTIVVDPGERIPRAKVEVQPLRFRSGVERIRDPRGCRNAKFIRAE